MNNVASPKDAWVIEPKDTACVVIDMQKAFVDDAARRRCIGGKELVPKMNELTSLCRTLNMPVIFVKADRRADNSDAGLVAEMSFSDPHNEYSSFQGKIGNQFCDGLHIEKNDYIVPKVRYSPFVPGSSQLEALLRGMGIHNIILSGVATDVCVGMTAMEAMMIGFKVFLVSDLTATFTLERQKVALEVYDMHCARVLTLTEVKAQLAGKI